jgi:hypothetical protein
MTTIEQELRLRLFTGPLTTPYGTLASIGSVRQEIITQDPRFASVLEQYRYDLRVAPHVVFVRTRGVPYQLRC